MSSTITFDYYSVLQVHPDADQEVIDAAYRQLMRKYHPDRAGGDPARSAALHARAKALNEAYAVLRDPQRRHQYDRQRPGPRRPAPPPPSAPPPPPPSAPPRSVPFEPEPSPWWAPLSLLAAGYYLLPGPYEWERGGLTDLISVIVLPPWASPPGRCSPAA